MKPSQPLLGFIAKLQVLVKSLVSTQAETGAKDYLSWRRKFMQNRLRLGLGIAILSFFTFTVLELANLFFDPTHFQGSWLWSQLLVEVSLLACWVILKTPIGDRYPSLILLGFSWSMTLIPMQTKTLLNPILEPDILIWPLTFIGLATLVPVCWRIHLLCQFGVFAYFIGISWIQNLPIQMSAAWLSPAVLTLYLFWVCVLCNLSVYLYERVQQAEFRARRQLEEAYRQLESEQRRSEQLLLNILPQPIAERLKRDRATIADSFAEVTVLFADIVGFTEISAKISPPELVSLLNQIFSLFDQLADEHGLEKIKTIGDAYMVVAGLPEHRQDHVEAIAEMALAMQAALNQFNIKMDQNFRIRIGIATGPVVAGVIGIKKFIYDLWGDTVNMASRMESHGIPGRIQVTQETYECLKDHYLLEERGKIHVKGRGEMLTYLLTGKR